MSFFLSQLPLRLLLYPAATQHVFCASWHCA
jgi:hypothetical protein